MMYENKRNGMQAKLIRENTGKDGNGTYVLQYENGKVNSVTASTFKRWWKKSDIQPVEEVQEKPKRTRNTKNNPDIELIKEYIYNKVNELGCEVFTPAKDIKMRAFKLEGHMTSRITYSGKSVCLHTRSKSLIGIENAPNPDKVVNHMMDNTFVFTELTDRAKKDIDIILESSYNYQLLKNNKKKESEEKKNGKIQSK